MAKKKAERSIAEDRQINKYDLDGECEHHPSIYHYWSKRRADAHAAATAAADRVKVVKAEVNLDYRKRATAGEDLGAKPTEAFVASLIDADGRVADARMERAEAWHQYGILDAAVSSLEHKRTMINGLMDLWARQYYSAPGGKRRDEDLTDTRGRELRGNLNERPREDEDEEDG